MKRKNLAKRFSCGLLAGALVFQGIPFTIVNAVEVNLDSQVGEPVLRTEEQPLGENVALGKTVYVGPAPKTGSTLVVTDGNTGSGWQDTTNKSATDWCVVDLGREYVIDKLNVFQDPGVRGTYQMYVADGNTAFDESDLASVIWNPLGEEQTNAAEDNYTFPQKKVRYIRYQSVTNDTDWGVQIKEIEAYTVGTTEVEKVPGTNIATGKDVTAPENDEVDDKGNVKTPAGAAGNMVDGNADTRWISYGQGTDDSWFILDLGENNKNEYDMVWLQTYDKYAIDYTIYVAGEIAEVNPESSSKWEPVYETTGASGRYQECMLDEVHTERYIMFKAAKVYYDNTGLDFSEIGVLKREEIVPKNLYLDYDKITLNMADDSQKTKQLQTAVNPSNADNQVIAWESSDTEVVEVSKYGLVTAVAAGTATVTATITTKDTEVKASCEVEVINDTIDAPTNVVAEHDEEKEQVIITWDSVEKAASYEVYCIKEGESAEKIGTVSVEDPSYIAEEPSYTADEPTSGGNYTYFVRAISSSGAKADSEPSNEIKILPELTGIKLNKTSLTMRANTTAELSVTTTPAEDVKPYELVWEVVGEGEDIVTVKNGMITANEVGTATIKVSVKDKENIFQECTVTVKEALKEYEEAPLPEDHVYGKNVALNKKVTALVGNEEVDSGSLKKNRLVDGDTNSSFQPAKPEGVEKEDWEQYYIIDLGKEYVIDTVKIFWQSACASEYQIQVAEAVDKELSDEDVADATDEGMPDEDESETTDEVMPAVDDPDAWKTVAVEDDYQTAGSREVKEHTFTPIKARYVKLNCSKAATGYFFNIYEIEVYTPGRENIVGNFKENLATGVEIQDESAKEKDTDAAKLIDGNLNSFWKPTNESAGTEHFTLDLGEAKEFNIVKLIPAENVDRWAKVYTLSVSNDNKEWTTVYEEKNGEHAEKYCLLDNVEAQYLKFECKGANVDNGYSIALAEIEIYNITGIETKGITVGPGIMTLTDYERTKNITAVVNPLNADNRTVVYESTDPTIASVDANTGAVTGLKSGTTTVKATVDGTKISAEITVIVKKAIDKVDVTASMEKKTDHAVTIKWNKLETAKSYTVQRVSQEKTETVAGGLTDNTYTDTDVPSGTYTYQIVAMPIDEEYSIFSISEKSDEVVVPVDLTSIAVKDITVKIGDTKKFAVTVEPEEATYPNVTYSVSDKDIIAINQENGTVTGLKEGTVKVTVKAKDYPTISDTCTVTVEKVPVTGITLVSEDIKDNTLGLDEEGTLMAVIAPQDASYKGVTWKSSDEKVATVDETGKVKPVGIGTVTITAISDDVNTVTATYTISVIQKKVQEVTLNIEKKTLAIDESFDLTVTVKPDTALNKAVEWTSSNPKVAEVNAAGKVTAIAAGTADIIVTTKDGEKTATCKVTVEKEAPLPEDHVYGKNVALNKKVTALVGNDEVTGSGSLKKNRLVDGDTNSSFQPAEPEGVKKEDWKQYYIIDLGQEYVIDTVKIFWQSACASEYQIQVAEASDKGMPDVNNAEAWKRMAVEDNYQIAGSREVKDHHFAPIKARYVKLNCSKAATGYFFNIYEIEVYTVGTGRVEGDFTENLAEGAKIEAQSEIASKDTDATKLIDGNSDSYWRPANESAGKEYFILDLGEEKEFNMVKLIPSSVDRWAKVYTLSVLNDNEEWTTVYEEKNGEHAEKYCMFDKVKAQYLKFECKGANVNDGYSIALAEIEVYYITGIETKGITVGPGTMTLTLNDEPTKNITAVVNPINADKRTVVYKSDDSAIASVDEAGLVTGKKLGKTTVTVKVKDTDISAEVTVFVKNAIDKVTNVKASMEKKTDHVVTIKWDTVEEAESYTVQRVSQETTETVAKGLTENTYTDKNVPSGTYYYRIVAMPSDEGEYITFSISDLSNKVVVPVDVTSVAVEDITVKIGDTEKLAVTVTPKDATYPNVTYSVSDNDIIAIDEENGTVTGLKEGTIKVTVEATDYPAICDICTVTVEKVPVTGITLVTKDLEDNTLGLDEEKTLTAVIAPEDASYKGVTWESSDPEVATVDETGKVTPHATGKVTITAISNDDNKITATYTIAVIQKKVQEVTLDVQEKNLAIGESFDLTATVKPDTALNKAVEWTSSNPKVAEVNAAGKVTAIAAGTADITVTTKDGEKTATCKVTVTKKEGSVTIPDVTEEGSVTTPDVTEEVTITLDGKSGELKVGETVTVKATVTPEGTTVDWRSSNNNVATVENGVIKGVAKGIAIITATAGNKNAAYIVTVKDENGENPDENGDSQVVAIVLSQSSAALKIGETVILTTTIAPINAVDKTITWNSSNPGVATVNGGIILAEAVGTATITATAASGVKAECIVTVTNDPQNPGNNDDPQNPGDNDDPQNPGDNDDPQNPGDNDDPQNPGDNDDPQNPGDNDDPQNPGDNDDIQNPGNNDDIQNPGDNDTQIPGENDTQIPGENDTQTPEDNDTQTPGENEIQNPESETTQTGEQLTVSKVAVAAEGRPYGIKTIYLKKNARLKLKATVTGSEGIDTNVTYTTSDQNIVSVSNGQIKAGKKTGTADITVASVFDPTKQATVKVKVVEKAAPNKVLKLKKTKLSIKAKGEQAQIQLKKYTKTTTDTVSYKVVSGKKYVKVDKYGVITSKANPGKKALTAKVQVTCGSKKAVVTVTIPKKK